MAPPPLSPWKPGPPVPVHDDSLQIQHNRKPIYDFSLFTPAPAVFNKSLSDEYQGKVPVLTIPSTKIPSPLADYISPEKIRDLKEYLCGPSPLPNPKPPTSTGIAPVGLFGIPTTATEPNTQFKLNTKVSAPPTNGPEIWASWKRAYDLWNGFYIEGRISKAWIGSEYKRIEDDANEQERRIYQGMFQTSTGNEYNSTANTGNEVQKWLQLYDEEDQETGESILNPEWKKRQAEIDLSNGGGFFPMKTLKEFETFEAALEEGEEYAEQWTDGVQNTIWRPKRFGENEKSPLIDIDDDVGVSFAKQIVGGIPDVTGFNGWINGGVDCGRSPFPVLRPKTTYKCYPIESNPHRYGKHVSWDGVTGTVFNMPMSALHPPDPYADNPVDMRQLTITTAYGDYIRDPRAESYGWAHKGTFPLDIRRVVQEKDANAIQPAEDVDTHEVVDLDDDYLLPKRRVMIRSDPWWVTEEQRLKRDVPTRLQPPSSLKYNKEVLTEEEEWQVDGILPVNDRAWTVEQGKDYTGKAQYFLTNLHGGKLIVNGLEITKGFVAGPLPEFAVIENGHGQVSFWWGVEGRDHGASERHGETVKQDQADWVGLRMLPGCEYLGMDAGEVWTQKIADRREREKTGDNLEDDGFWRDCKLVWQRGGVSLNLVPRLTGIPPVWDGIFGNPALSFASPHDEFKYLVIKREAQRKQKILEMISRGVDFPAGDSSWPGRLPVLSTAEQTAAEQAISFWQANQTNLKKYQRSFAKDFLRFIERFSVGEKVKAAKAATASKKRKAEADLDLPEPKRPMLHHNGLPLQTIERLNFAAIDYLNYQKDRKAQVKLRLKGISPEDDARIERDYLEARDKSDRQAQIDHMAFNNKRKALGRPEVSSPARWNFRSEEIEKHIQGMTPLKNAIQNAGKPMGAQPHEVRKAILQQQEASLKAMEKKQQEENAKREADQALVKERNQAQQFAEKQRLGLNKSVRETKAEEEKRTREREEEIFNSSQYGFDVVAGQGPSPRQTSLPTPPKTRGKKTGQTGEGTGGHTSAGGNGGLATTGKQPLIGGNAQGPSQGAQGENIDTSSKVAEQRAAAQRLLERQRQEAADKFAKQQASAQKLLDEQQRRETADIAEQWAIAQSLTEQQRQKTAEELDVSRRRAEYQKRGGAQKIEEELAAKQKLIEQPRQEVAKLAEQEALFDQNNQASLTKAALEKSQNDLKRPIPSQVFKLQMLNARARFAKMTPIHYANSEGYLTVDDYVKSAPPGITIRKVDSTPKGNKDLAYFLRDTRQLYREAIVSGAELDSKVNGTNIKEWLKKYKGWNGSLEEYANYMALTKITPDLFSNVVADVKPLVHHATAKQRAEFEEKERVALLEAERVNVGRWKVVREKIDTAARHQMRIEAIENGVIGGEEVYDVNPRDPNKVARGLVF